MSGIMSELYFFLLQNQVRYFKEDNPKELKIFLIVIGAVIVIAIVVRFITGGIGSSSAGGSKGKSGGSTSIPRKFNAFTLYSIASTYGLDREQTKLLEFVFRNDAVADPEKVLRTPALLDRHFKRAYKTIAKNSSSDDEAQQRLVRLFSLRNIIEAAPASGGAPTAGQLAENTPAVLVCGKESYPVKVLSSRGQNVVTDLPRNALGTPVRLSKGSRITLSFFTKSSKGFSFDGHVVGAVDTMNGPGLQISHTGKIKALVKRMYRRRQAAIRCEFFLVFVEETGKKSPPKLTVDTKRFTGTVQDVSIGGCSIKTSAPVQVGSRLKITLDYSDNFLISVLGQVLRANRSPSGTIIHIKFLKVPRKAFNSINAFVFGYDEQ